MDSDRPILKAMASGIDFNLPRYIAKRKSDEQLEFRTSSAYAYKPEFSFRKALSQFAPIRMALAFVHRSWDKGKQQTLFRQSVRASAESHPIVSKAASVVAEQLQMRLPPVFISDQTLPTGCLALGTNASPLCIIDANIPGILSENQLVALLGREFGRIQNHLVEYSTVLYHLLHTPSLLARITTKPAVLALQAWSRRATITCDRASVLACQSLTAAQSSLIATNNQQSIPEENVEDYIEKAKTTKTRTLSSSEPSFQVRLFALRLFSESTFYQVQTNQTTTNNVSHSTDQIDQEIREKFRLP